VCWHFRQHGSCAMGEACRFPNVFLYQRSAPTIVFLQVRMQSENSIAPISDQPAHSLVKEPLRLELFCARKP